MTLARLGDVRQQRRTLKRFDLCLRRLFVQDLHQQLGLQSAAHLGLGGCGSLPAELGVARFLVQSLLQTLVPCLGGCWFDWLFLRLHALSIVDVDVRA